MDNITTIINGGKINHTAESSMAAKTTGSNKSNSSDSRSDSHLDTDSDSDFDEIKSTSDDRTIEDVMRTEHSYPDQSDKNLQYKLYKKREFFFHKMSERPNLESYPDIKEYRDNLCDRAVTLFDHQSMLSNFINPDTPFKGILLFHNVGTGKTCSGLAIAEKFKAQVQKYGTKIYILVNGPFLKESWKKHLVKCTGETYLKYIDKTQLMNEQEKNRLQKNAEANALQYYRFMSYRSFYKRVLGEKITDKKVVKGDKIKMSYRKTEEGDFERDLADERIHNLNNTLLIVDEAHNLTNNAYGDALKKIIRASMNLKIVLLTATPMKNTADHIVELINFIRPENSPMERDKIFTSDKNHEMKFKENGLEYFKNMARGYISHIRGADPLTYAKRIDKGEVPEQLSFTKLIRCDMLEFQKKIYQTTVAETMDSLDRRSEAVANIAFPGLTTNKKNITGYYGKDGINILKNQIKSYYEVLNKKIISDVVYEHDDKDFDMINLSDDGKKISGRFMNEKYLNNFSCKFYRCLKKINRLIWGKKGPKTAFIYSNLVKVGIDVFSEVLKQNGYLEYQEDYNKYRFQKDTKCYFCGIEFGKHDDIKFDEKLKLHDLKYGGERKDKQQSKNSETNGTYNNGVDRTDDDDDDDNTQTETSEKNDIFKKSGKKQKYDSDSSTDYEPYKKFDSSKKSIPFHEFRPATFVTVTAKSNDDTGDDTLPEEQSEILKNVFSNVSNKNGKFIKFVLGSKVINEGISLFNVAEVHILDVYFNLGRVDQVVGRAIRFCSHNKVMNEDNKFPFVNVYKYAVRTGTSELSTEEELYKKAEYKYMLVKKVERIMKEIAIDCPLNEHGNIFEEEMRDFADCGEKGKQPCPSICDYTKCNYKCDDIKLNAEFYDPKRKMYKKIEKKDLDYSTFTNALARNEIDFAKQKIKELYLRKYNHTLDEIIAYVKKSYDVNKVDLFDEFFIFKALDELIPTTENEFNNFKDTILDKYNRPGYLIYVDKYYLYQPFDQNENVSMHYRTSFETENTQKLSLYNYLRNTTKYNLTNKSQDDAENADEYTDNILDNNQGYDFENVMDYYDSREEFKYVGIIDKGLSRRKSKKKDEINDVFKIRDKRGKILDKKRATGVVSFLGCVCTSKDRNVIVDIAKTLNLTDNNYTRESLCKMIQDELMDREKYQTGKHKLTYFIVPFNHETLHFPYNLEDRRDYVINQIDDKIKYKIKYDIEKNKKDSRGWTITIKHTDKLDDYVGVLEKLRFVRTGDLWILDIV